MDESYHNIRRLYLEKLTGTISQEEDHALTELLYSNKQVQHIWEMLEKECMDLNAQIILDRINPSQELEEWTDRFVENTDAAPVRVWGGWWRGVAAVVLLAIGFSYFFSDSVRSMLHLGGNSTAIVSKAGRVDDIKLTLADGKSIAFSKNKSEEYAVGGVQLKNSGSQLQYAGSNQEAFALHTLEVPAIKDYSIVLSDGTRIYLNSQSSLRFPFQFRGDTREIYIEGEAYLEVAKDEKKPFIVHTPINVIQVVGTQFNVNTYEPGLVRTSLVEGSVLLKTTDRKPLQLLPGQEAAYSKKSGFSTSTFDPVEVLAWREGVYYFHRLPLEDLSAILSRWFNLNLTFEGGRLPKHMVSGMLEKGHLEEFLQDLNRTSGITYSLQGSTLTLK
jgi:transmembrane sensor